MDGWCCFKIQNWGKRVTRSTPTEDLARKRRMGSFCELVRIKGADQSQCLRQTKGQEGLMWGTILITTIAALGNACPPETTSTDPDHSADATGRKQLVRGELRLYFLLAIQANPVINPSTRHRLVQSVNQRNGVVPSVLATVDQAVFLDWPVVVKNMPKLMDGWMDGWIDHLLIQGEF